MQLLDTIYEEDFRQADKKNRENYYHRKAARAVLTDEQGEVFLMYVGLHKYHKLPGGGINVNEEIKQALARELMEEVGCKAEIVAELGEIIEYRDFEAMKQTSFCYVAKQIGNVVEPTLEEDEIAEEMVQLKAKNISEAIRLFESDKPDNTEGLFIQRRDLAFLRAAQHFLQS